MENITTKPEVVFFENEDNFLYVLRNAFDKTKMREFKSSIDNYKDNGNHDEQFVLGVAPAKFRLNQQWFDLWKDFNFNANFLSIDQYSQLTYPPQVRVVSRQSEFVPWHQDNAYIQALGNRGHQKIVTCFVPLEEDLEDRATLQFGTKTYNTALDHTFRNDVETNKLSLNEIYIPDDNQTVEFDLKLGDALLFGKYVVHRTYSRAENLLPRHSMEFRLTTPDARIQGKDYYDLRTHDFGLFKSA
jgi:curved DNA-binding protein CbpA